MGLLGSSHSKKRAATEPVILTVPLKGTWYWAVITDQVSLTPLRSGIKIGVEQFYIWVTDWLCIFEVEKLVCILKVTEAPPYPPNPTLNEPPRELCSPRVTVI
jgi:hypothetical protein